MYPGKANLIVKYIHRSAQQALSKSICEEKGKCSVFVIRQKGAQKVHSTALENCFVKISEHFVPERPC